MRNTLSLTAALIGTVACAFGQFPDFTPPTPLLGALLRGENAELQRLLDSGANPNEGRFVGAPPLVFAMMTQNSAAARALLKRGADVKTPDAAGSTALMWAAAYETPDPSMIEDLLSRGADINSANKAGDTALAWALRRGYTPAVETLKQHGASDSAMIKTAVEKAIALLQKSGPEFVKVSGCASCHNQSVPQLAYAAARDRGFAVDPQISDKQVKTVVGMFKPYTEVMMKGTESIPDPAISVSYALVGLAAEGHAPDATTEAMAHLVSLQQTPEGYFRALPARPPIESSTISATALSIRALQVYGKDSNAAIERALAWLVDANPRSTEDRAMQIMGMAWAKADPDYLWTAAQALMAEQRADGGWAQLANVETDAYATGQALVALQASGQVRTTDAAYQRGAGYLLRTQRPDGSWHVRSRVFPFQPYKESGFPHGKDQWISAAGTGWAAMALSLTAHPAAQDVSE